MSDVQATTVLQRMVAAGIDEARARQQLADGWVLVGGAVVTDPDSPAPHPAAVILNPLLAPGSQR